MLHPGCRCLDRTIVLLYHTFVWFRAFASFEPLAERVSFQEVGLHDLTPRQQQVLEIVAAQFKDHGRAPTVREIASAMGVKAVGPIQDHLKALVQKGYLERDPGLSRGLRLTERAPSAERVPIVGRIAAGRPIEAVTDLEYLDVVQDLQLEGAYLLRVKGESMIEDHIADGDYVVIQPQAHALDGQIVVALLPDGEATLKRYYREADHIRLQPANHTMEPIRVREAVIQGRVVAVIRRVH